MSRVARYTTNSDETGAFRQDEPPNGIDPRYRPQGPGTSNSRGDVKSPVGQILPEFRDDNFQIPGAQLPSSRGKDLAATAFNRQSQAAGDYLAKMKENSDRAYLSLQKESKKKLDRSIKGVKNDFNARGLLNSGLSADAEGGARTAANIELARGRSDINRGLLQNLDLMEGNVFNTANVLAQPGPDTANPYLSGIGSELALETGANDLAAQMAGNISGGVGAIGGAGLASLISQGRGYNPAPRYYDYSRGGFAERTA